MSTVLHERGTWQFKGSADQVFFDDLRNRLFQTTGAVRGSQEGLTITQITQQFNKGLLWGHASAYIREMEVTCFLEGIMADWASNILLWCIILVIPVLFLLLRRRRSGSVRLPPGPPGWPVFGNMFDLGAMPHETLAGLRHKYGDVVWLNLGAIKTTVVQSSKAAAELFKNQDLCFSDRTITETMRAQGYHESSLALAPYGPHWRSLRRLMTMEMLVTKRINETAGVRRKCVDDMLSWIEEEARGVGGEGRGIQVAHFVFLASFNMLGNLMLSCDLLHPGSKEGSEFFEVMVRVMEWSGHPNFADFFPWLRWMDPQGLRKKAERDLGIAMKIASGFVQERIKRGPAAEDHKKDFLDVLLDFQGSGKNEPPQISDKDLNIIILVSRQLTFFLLLPGINKNSNFIYILNTSKYQKLLLLLLFYFI